MKFARTARLLFAVCLPAVLLIGFAPVASAHQSGCHAAHSCPSDTGSYICGDTGNYTYCGGRTAPAPLPLTSVCDSHYPGLCLPSSPDVDCGDAAVAGRTDFTALYPDPHGLDADSDGIACESSEGGTGGYGATPTATITPVPASTSTPARAWPPMVLLSPSIIDAGERVEATYFGEPGETLTIMAKTQPATVYSRIGTVTLDSSGIGKSSHAPRKNTRIQAVGPTGLGSDQELVQVTSVASFNARRVGLQTYTFSGTVSPARSGRLVSVYRDFVLVAQGRTDYRGVYTITKRVAPGDFLFWSKTGNDTYNLGATSRIAYLTIR